MTIKNIFTGLRCLLKGASGINIFGSTLLGGRGGGSRQKSALCTLVKIPLTVLYAPSPIRKADVREKVKGQAKTHMVGREDRAVARGLRQVEQNSSLDVSPDLGFVPILRQAEGDGFGLMAELFF